MAEKEWVVCKKCPHLSKDKNGNYCGHNHEDGTITQHEGTYLDCPLIKMEQSCDMPLDFAQTCENLLKDGICKHYRDHPMGNLEGCPNQIECDDQMSEGSEIE